MVKKKNTKNCRLTFLGNVICLIWLHYCFAYQSILIHRMEKAITLASKLDH